MAASVNRVWLLGNLGADPELRYLPSGDPVANLRLATSSSWKDKNSGEWVEKAEWHRVVLFNGLAERAGKHLKKGSQISVIGSLETKKWTNKAGVDQYTTQIRGEDMQILGGRIAGATNPDSPSSSPPKSGYGDGDEGEDSIPF